MQILIIESETYLAQSLARKLENEGHICRVRMPNQNIQDDSEYDVALLGSFFESAKLIKSYPNSVIIILANYLNSDITSALRAGANDYILKPVIVEELLRKINMHSAFLRAKQLNESFEGILQEQNNYNLKDLLKLRLPLRIECSSVTNCDIFVYALAKAKNRSFLRLKNDLSKLNSSLQILYFYNFDELSQKEQDSIKESKNKKLIIRSSQELEGFSTYEINTYNTNIMPIDDYIKHCIISHQDTYSDTQLASILGISRKSLWERRRKYDIAKKK